MMEVDGDDVEAALAVEAQIAEEAAEAAAAEAAEAEAAAVAAAEGPSPPPSLVGRTRHRRTAAFGGNYAGQDADARSDVSSEAAGPSASNRGAGAFTRRVGGDEDDAGMRYGVDHDATSSYTTHQLGKGLAAIPGWGPQIMGQGIPAEPPVFATGLAGDWIQYNNDGPFRPDKRCRPARVIDMGFVGAWQQASDAERISDMTAQTDKWATSRTVATCALMGLLSVGTAKGFVASDNHSEITRAKANAKPSADQEDDDDKEEEQAKVKRKLNGNIKTYTYYPNPNDNDPEVRSRTAMMFCYVHIAMHDRAGKYVGFKILMLIFDKGFSTDMLVRKVMEENSKIKASGLINGMPEEQRTSKLERQNKIQRTQINDETLETTAAIQYRRICSNQDWIRFMDSVGCQRDGHEGRPYYANMKTDTRAGCATDPFMEHKEWGGNHPIGPSVSHNHKRYVPPSEDGPGVNVFTAGTLDQRGLPIDLHPSLVDPTKWYDPQTQHFDPPQHVKDNGWCHFCHNPAVTNIFDARLPQKRNGNIEPDDCLLRQYWELYKDSNPILLKAQQKGMATYEQNRDSVLSLFHREDDMDPDQHRLSRAVLETDLLSNDSIDKSAAEEAALERRAYGKAQTENNGTCWVFSIRQILRDISIEQEKVHAMVSEYDKQQRSELRSANYNAQPGSVEVVDRHEATRRRQAEHAEATTSAIKLGLQRFRHAYGAKKMRKYIPPGYHDIAHIGLNDSIKKAGEIATRRHAASLGRLVDPDNSDAGIGTANIGFAHSQSLVATDFTPFGHHRAFLFHLFSAGLRIAGGDVKIMLDLHSHAFEPFQEVSYVQLWCGGAGSGKSMRYKRMQSLLTKGWIEGTGSASAKAGMNGGFDFLCGRLVTFDEVPADFASNDSDRIEYWKSVTMEQRVLNQRTVKVMGENGMDSFTTVVLDSLHYESYLICTNCGPLGIKGEDVEPSTNRTALTDRSWAHIVHSADDDDATGDVEFNSQALSDAVKQQVNRYRVCAGLVAYVLIFIKHIPSCRPNLTYATMLCNKWNDILWNEYNIQKPSKRKKIKLRMLLELFATESAVFEKFFLRESGVDFEDMHPDENGNLSPFCIEQLTDVVRSLQRCVDLEVIHTAWSQCLDVSHMTCAHRFQMMTELSGLHGTGLERHTLTGETAPLPPPQPPKQGKHDEPDTEMVDRRQDEHAAWRAGQPNELRASTPPSQQPDAPQFSTAPVQHEPIETVADDDPGTFDLDGAMAQARQQGNFTTTASASSNAASNVMGVINNQRGAEPQQQPQQPQQPQTPQTPQQPQPQTPVQLTPEQQMAWQARWTGPSQSAKSTNGEDTNNVSNLVRMMHESITREKCAERARELGQRRELRCELSKRLMTKLLPRSQTAGQHQQITKVLTDKVDETSKERLMRLESTGEEISATLAAGACMPDVQDVLNSGIDEQFVQDVVQARMSSSFDREHAMVGLQSSRHWEHKTRPTDKMKEPADYDFNWARLKVFGNAESSGDAPSGGKTKRTVWSTSAREINKLTKGGLSSPYSLMKVKSMTFESMRDTLFMMAQSLSENKIRIPRYNSIDREALNARSRMLIGTETFKDKTNPPMCINPVEMMVKNAQGLLMTHPDYVKPKGVERPQNSLVSGSGCEKRLDHMIDRRALPSCIMPDSFERGVPIMECENTNGIYFNKYAASEHAALVVESTHYLANVPGIADGNLAEVPRSFKVDGIKAGGEDDAAVEAMDVVETVRREVEAKRKAAAKAAETAQVEATAKRRRVAVPTGTEEEGEEDADSSFVVIPENEAEASEQESTPAPSPLASDAPNPDLATVQRSVAEPDSRAPGVAPKPGATDQAAGASVEPSAKKDALPLLWDQLSTFFSFKMAETLHNDCQKYVKAVTKKFPSVYEHEELDETLRRLPHISLRFPGTVERNTNRLLPLSCPLPLKQSRYCDVSAHVESTRASKELTEAVESFAHGRAVASNDPEVLEFEAETRGVNTGFVMEGNLFARSTWQRFTLSALDARGMRTPQEEARVNDQGLCMSHRVRNHMIASGEKVRDVDFGGGTLAMEQTFAAQERNKRMRANRVASQAVETESASAQSHAMEIENDREVMEAALELQFGV